MHPAAWSLFCSSPSPPLRRFLPRQRHGLDLADGAEQQIAGAADSISAL